MFVIFPPSGAERESKKERKEETTKLMLSRSRTMLNSRLFTLLRRVRDTDAILIIHSLDLIIRQPRELFSSPDISHILNITLGEDQVDFFQAAVGSLGVKEVNDGNEASIQGCEEQISTPVNTSHHYGRDHDNREVEQPVAAGGYGIGLGAGLNRGQFGRIQPGQRKPGGSEAGHVEEETEHGPLLDLGSCWDQTGECDNHGNELDPGTVEEEVTATYLLNEEPGECSEDGVDDHVDTTD